VLKILQHDKIWGTIPRSKFWGTCPPVPPRDLSPWYSLNYSDYYWASRRRSCSTADLYFHAIQTPTSQKADKYSISVVGIKVWHVWIRQFAHPCPNLYRGIVKIWPRLYQSINRNLYNAAV